MPGSPWRCSSWGRGGGGRWETCRAGSSRLGSRRRRRRRRWRGASPTPRRSRRTCPGSRTPWWWPLSASRCWGRSEEASYSKHLLLWQIIYLWPVYHIIIDRNVLHNVWNFGYYNGLFNVTLLPFSNSFSITQYHCSDVMISFFIVHFMPFPTSCGRTEE